MVPRVETLRLALKLLARQPGRSALTVLGLVIGVGAFIAMVSFGEGARQSVISQFGLLGANLIRIQTASDGAVPRARPPLPLTNRDVTFIEREATTILRVLPVARRNGSVAYGAEQRSTVLVGAAPGYLAAHSWDIAAGGGFDSTDFDQDAKVCVVGATPVRALFGGQDPLGQTLTLAGVLPCRIIGVLADKGFSTSGTDLDDTVLVPTTTFSVHLSDKEGFSYIEVEPLDSSLLDAAIQEVTEILRRAHGTGADEPSDVSISSPLEVIRAVDQTSRILSTLLAAIAGVSLLVGGIGIMNIQLVSVAERTSEIGVRAAIGASPRQILTQFLIEALLLTAIGTAVGVALGIGVASLVAGWMQWPRVISPGGVSLSASFGMLVGIVFGYIPARRAAHLDPIHALRRE